MAGKKIKTLVDIEEEREAKERQEFKKKVSGDIKDIFDDFFKPEKKPEKKKSKFWAFRNWLGIIFLLIFLLTFILGILWLLKFFLKELFGI